jgi:uncharacterized protein (DUF1778 family)
MSEKNQHWGSTLDDFLHEEGIYEAARKEVVIALDTAERAAFMAALAAPTKAKPRLEELLKNPSVFERSE